MPFCTGCGKEILPADGFCLNCGRKLNPSVAGPSAPYQVFPAAPLAMPSKATSSKSPIAAAILNFLIPGTGYMHTGLSRDTGEVIFGGPVLFFSIGFEVWFGATAFTTALTSTITGPGSPYEALIFLVILLPLAFVYDGYRRARSTEP